MRTQAFPPQILGAPVAVNRLTSSTPYYYSPPAADADGNYSASFSLWDGSGDGAITATGALTLGKYPWVTGREEWWGYSATGQVTRWGVVDFGTALAANLGPLSLPSVTSYNNSMFRDGVAEYAPNKLGVYMTGDNSPYYANQAIAYWDITTGELGSPSGVSLIMAQDHVTASTRMFLWSPAVPLLIYVNNGASSEYLVNGVATSGAAVGARNVLSSAVGASSDVVRMSDDKLLYVNPGGGNIQAVRYSSGVWTNGAAVTATGVLTCAALSSSLVAACMSATRIDLFAFSSIIGSLVKSTTTGISISGTVVGAVRLSLNEFLVLSTSSGSLLGTRFIIDANNNTLQRQTIVIDSATSTINNQGVQSTVLPFNRVMLNYGAGSSQTSWRSKILRSIA